MMSVNRIGPTANSPSGRKYERRDDHVVDLPNIGVLDSKGSEKMTPTIEELLEGSTTWRKVHKEIIYLLSYHGYCNPDPADEFVPEGHPGVWSYYLLIREQMYPHCWQDFACVRTKSGFEIHGPAFQNGMFDTEITWSSSEPYWCRETNRMWDAVKVGCDYAHAFQRDLGYPDSYISVNNDAKRTVEKFLKVNPDPYLRCSYSGMWDKKENFYKAQNGKFAHISCKGSFSGTDSKWRPEDD